MRRLFLMILCGVALAAIRLAAQDAASGLEFFEKHVRPVFVEHCYKCHSAEAEKLKGGLRLDSRETLLKGGDTGPAVVAGDPEKSLLIRAVRYTDSDLQMPPKDKRLSEAQIAHLVEWVKSGAPMSSHQYSVISNDSITVARTNWAFRKPIDPPVPEISRAVFSNQSGTAASSLNTISLVTEHSNPIDAFLRVKLTERRLTPAPPADKRTLIRRATYDLTGLPPTPDEIDGFLKDDSTNAFTKVVERLLASPRYGEKWARHWLDVVRYTDSFDSRGLGGEGDVPEAWRYRDWVVNALNSDMPYDQFIVQQIAGDILATNRPGRFDTNALIATGVYAIGEWGTGDADKEKMLTDVIDDQIDVTGRGFLGLTLACARCHDHKFDPISTEDYYGVAGIFFSSHILPNPGLKTAGSPVLRIPLASAEELATRKKREDRASELEKEINAKAGAQLLTKSERGGFNQPTLASLHPASGDDLPSAVANSGDATITFLTITLPPRTVGLHPSPEKNAAAVWVSPVTAELEISGRVADADDKCGNGVEWTLFHGTNAVQSGKFDNGKEQKISATNLTVKAGELLTLAVLPRGKNHSCDTTVLSLEIRERGGQGAWRLPEDMVADLPERANNGAWHFIAYAGTPPLRLQLDLSDDEKQKLERARSELAAVRKELDRRIPVAHGLQEGGTPKSAHEGIRDARIHIRGRYDRLGAVVSRGFPGVLARDSRWPIADGQSGRMELARWIASPENPLTARVMVNRIWQHHFGEGIVRTPNNFGKLGTPPTHPELLDWLAHRFIESGWSIKAMHRLMMNSAAYHRASQYSVSSNQHSVASPSATEDWKLKTENRWEFAARDPGNEFFSCFNRRRLTAEEIRDSLLFAAGQLDVTIGGPAINDLNAKRRTLYVMTIRSDRSNYRSLFDAPDAQTIAEGRIDSTVAPQALFLLNHPFALAQAGALAERAIKREPGDDAARIRWLYTLLYGREPNRTEIDVGLRAISGTKDEHRAGAWTRYCQVLLCANEFAYVD